MAHKPETITLGDLRKMANVKGRIREAARKALTVAERANSDGSLASILLDRELRSIQVYTG